MGTIASITNADVRALCTLANALDWHAREGSHGEWLLYRRHDGEHGIHFPARTGLSISKFRGYAHQIVRYGDQKILNEITIEDHMRNYRKLDASHRTIIENALRAHHESTANVDDDPVLAREALTGMTPKVEATKPAERKPVFIATTASACAPTKPTRYIVSEEPTRAINGNATYDSKAVAIRKWSDNTTEFVCRWNGCDYTNEKRWSVVAHYRNHRRGMGHDRDIVTDGPLPVDHVVQHRRDARVSTLAAEIRKARQATGKESASVLAAWIIDHRIEETEEYNTTPQMPLTSDELLDRIALMIDRSKLPEFAERINSLQEQVLLASKRAEQAIEQRDRAEGDLDALRDMLNNRAGER